MSVYKHGVYGETGSASNVVDTTQVTTPIYIGTLPVHRIDEAKLNAVKHGKNDDCIMLLISSVKDVKNLNLFSDDWDSYSLCEAIDVHFMRDSAIAPIILLAKGTLAQTSAVTKATVSLVKSGTSHIGYVPDSKAVIDDMAIAVSGVTFEEGDISYSYEGDKVKIVISKAGFTASSVEVSYKQVTGEKMSSTDFENCLKFADRVEAITNRIPNILCAPQYSEDPTYHDLMIQKAIDKVNDKWNIVCASDIGEVTNIESALAWKTTNSYNHVLDKVFYPKLSFNGTAYHMSVIWTAVSQALDADNDNIPCKSASNKAVFADKIISNDTDEMMYISEQEANSLNQKGITSAITTKGQIRMWGSHMSNYDFGNISNIANEDRFDVAVRMSVYMRNYLQYHYLNEIDETINRKDIDSIINSIQMWLDSLVNEGKLLYATVEFDADSDLANGDVVFNIHVTYPCVIKSVTFKVIYTDKGLSVFTSTEEGVDE